MLLSEENQAGFYNSSYRYFDDLFKYELCLFSRLIKFIQNNFNWLKASSTTEAMHIPIIIYGIGLSKI